MEASAKKGKDNCDSTTALVSLFPPSSYVHTSYFHEIAQYFLLIPILSADNVLFWI